MRLFFATACVIIAILLGAGPIAAAEKGWFGFAAHVTAGSIFSFDPTISTIKIEKVEPNSPAARAGLVAGDEVLELENVKVTGNKASQLKPHMQKTVGQTLHLRLRHADGREYSAVLTAAAKP